jgi:hypothetical protein
MEVFILIGHRTFNSSSGDDDDDDDPLISKHVMEYLKTPTACKYLLSR